MKDREFPSHEDLEEAITVTWNDITFEDVQSIFYDSMRRLAWVIEWMLRSDGWPGTFFTPCNTPFSSSISLSF
jgi:hypothetical protein